MLEPLSTPSLVEEIGHPVHIILHIGMTKTGSTSFQNHLERHRSELATNGVLFPVNGFQRRDVYDLQRTPGHRELFSLIARGEVSEFIEECRNFYATCADPASARIVLSAEELFHDKPETLANFLTPRSGFLTGANFSVLAVVRHPYDWLRARYQERVTGGWAVEARSFDAFVTASLDAKMTDYPQWLDNFRLLLPDAKVDVLSYDQLASEGLIEKMVEALGQVPTACNHAVEMRSNVSAKIGLGLEAIRRVAIFSSCLDRDLRQLWRKHLLERFSSAITLEDGARLPWLRHHTRSRLNNHTAMMNGLLAATDLKGGMDIRISERPVAEKWNDSEEQRIDALADLALLELQRIIAAFPHRLLEPDIGFSLSIENCRSALSTRQAFKSDRTIVIDGDATAALVAATLGGRIIFLRGADAHQTRTLLSLLDQADMPSAVVDASLFSKEDLRHFETSAGG